MSTKNNILSPFTLLPFNLYQFCYEYNLFSHWFSKYIKYCRYVRKKFNTNVKNRFRVSYPFSLFLLVYSAQIRHASAKTHEPASPRNEFFPATRHTHFTTSSYTSANFPLRIGSQWIPTPKCHQSHRFIIGGTQTSWAFSDDERCFDGFSEVKESGFES